MRINIWIRVCVISFLLGGTCFAENVWEKHLEGKSEVPEAIEGQPKPPPPGKLSALAKEHFELNKKIKKMRAAGASKQAIKKLEKKSKETKKEYFKYKKKIRVSARQQRAVGVSRPQFNGGRRSNPQRRAVR